MSSSIVYIVDILQQKVLQKQKILILYRSVTDAGQLSRGPDITGTKLSFRIRGELSFSCSGKNCFNHSVCVKLKLNCDGSGKSGKNSARQYLQRLTNHQDGSRNQKLLMMRTYCIKMEKLETFLQQQHVSYFQARKT